MESDSNMAAPFILVFNPFHFVMPFFEQLPFSLMFSIEKLYYIIWVKEKWYHFDLESVCDS